MKDKSNPHMLAMKRQAGAIRAKAGTPPSPVLPARRNGEQQDSSGQDDDSNAFLLNREIGKEKKRVGLESMLNHRAKRCSFEKIPDGIKSEAAER